MATVQHPHHAPPGTAIRPDGMPAGRGGRYALWIALVAVACAGIAYAIEHAPRGEEAETVVRVAPQEQPRPEPAAPEPVAPVPTPTVAPVPTPEPAVPPDEPELSSPDDGVDSLTGADIKTGIAKVQFKIARCIERADATGTVRLKVNVSPSGRPSVVSVVETPDRVLGTCIAQEVKKAKFPKTRLGVTFTYPFVF